MDLQGNLKFQGSTNGAPAADAAANNVVVTYSVYTWNTSTGSYNTNAAAVLTSATQATVAAGAAIDNSTDANVSIALPTGTPCMVTVSITCSELSAPLVYTCYATVQA